MIMIIWQEMNIKQMSESIMHNKMWKCYFQRYACTHINGIGIKERRVYVCRKKRDVMYDGSAKLQFDIELVK